MHEFLAMPMHDEKPIYIVQTDPDPILHPRTLNISQENSTESSPPEETTIDETNSNRNKSRRHKPELHEGLISSEGHAEFRVSDTIIGNVWKF